MRFSLVQEGVVKLKLNDNEQISGSVGVRKGG